MNLFEKLSAISNNLEMVNKSFLVEVSKGKGYKAVSEADILSAVRPLEYQYKIFSYPISRRVVSQEIIKISDGEGKQKITYFERLETTYRFVDIEDPTQFIDIISYGDGIDNGDKSIGKAMTYADKYALMKCYKIITGEDPDKEASKTTFCVPEYKTPSSDIKYATEKQLDLVATLIKDKAYDRKLLKLQFGYDPSDRKMPLKTCQDMINFLKEVNLEDTPF